MSIMRCPVCDGPTKYSDQYAARYCNNCNVWAQDKCNDAKCRYCQNRPERPMKADEVVINPKNPILEVIF